MFWYALLSVLVLVRLPSLAQPAGADQSLYAYVGTRILEGELPYRDAWDQKPPAVHFTYALLYGIWPSDAVVAATDLAVAIGVAILLLPLGRAITGSQAAGLTAAALFLFAGDPSLTRLAGVRVRSQCETFIAAAITAAVAIAMSRGGGTPLRMLFAGLLLGFAATFKYNAIVYVVVVLAAMLATAGEWRHRIRTIAYLGVGVAVPPLVMIMIFAAGRALDDLYAATIGYNLEYSGETYAGVGSFVAYLLTFPVQQARIDALWTMGGLGCILLLVNLVSNIARGNRNWRPWIPVVWVAAACLSIAINGSRGLPQYFVQAAPALALAAGSAAAIVWPARRLPGGVRWFARAAGVTLVAVAAWRVTDFEKIPQNASHDLGYITGRLGRDAHLARYGGRPEDKYSALAVARLSDYLEQRTTADDRIYVFGFSPGVYVRAQRASASRFFWSRPIIVGFNAGSPTYGASGLLDELRAPEPVYVVLQIHDWAPPPGDSATFFLSDPLLGSWLRGRYQRVADFTHEDYDVWVSTRHASAVIGRRTR